MSLAYDLIYYFSAFLPFMLIPAMALYFLLKKQKKQAALFLVAVGLSFVVADFLKNLFNVPRPLGKGSTPSFPSGHASLAFCQARFFKNKKTFFLIGLLYATFVSIGRVYTGFHTIQDVFAGGLLGYAIGEITIRMKPRIEKTYKKLCKTR